MAAIGRGIVVMMDKSITAGDKCADVLTLFIRLYRLNNQMKNGMNS